MGRNRRCRASAFTWQVDNRVDISLREMNSSRGENVNQLNEREISKAILVYFDLGPYSATIEMRSISEVGFNKFTPSEREAYTRRD